MSYIKRHDEAARDKALLPWLRRAHGLIERRLADARVHAETGRPDLARERLFELQGELLRHPDATDGLLRDARATSYRQAIAHDGRFLDPAIADPDFASTTEAELAARTVPIAGRDEWAQLASQIDSALLSLPPQGLPDNLRGTAHAGWE